MKTPEEGREVGIPLSNGLMRISRWTGSHFHDWVDYKVAFSTELPTRMGCLGFGKKISVSMHLGMYLILSFWFDI